MRLTVTAAALLFLIPACSPDDAQGSTTSAPSSSTSTSGATRTTTTVPPTTTTAPAPTTTAAPTTTTTADPPPSRVTGVTAGLSGGSGEVFVEWDASAPPDLDHYNLYYSEDPGGTKELLAEVPGDETNYIDFPRDLTEGTNCYQVSAVDTGGNEGGRSTEACFTAS